MTNQQPRREPTAEEMEWARKKLARVVRLMVWLLAAGIIL